MGIPSRSRQAASSDASTTRSAGTAAVNEMIATVELAAASASARSLLLLPRRRRPESSPASTSRPRPRPLVNASTTPPPASASTEPVSPAARAQARADTSPLRIRTETLPVARRRIPGACDSPAPRRALSRSRTRMLLSRQLHILAELMRQRKRIAGSPDHRREDDRARLLARRRDHDADAGQPGMRSRWELMRATHSVTLLERALNVEADGHRLRRPPGARQPTRALRTGP